MPFVVSWEPSRHPVHRIILLLDTFAGAIHRFRQLSIGYEGYDPASRESMRTLRSEYLELKSALREPGDCLPSQTYHRLYNDILAMYHGSDYLNDASRLEVANAVQWALGIAGIGVPTPSTSPQLEFNGSSTRGYKFDNRRYDEVLKRAKMFDFEGERLLSQSGHRAALAKLLSHHGERIFRHVEDRQTSLIFGVTYTDEKAQLSHAVLLGWAGELKTYSFEIPRGHVGFPEPTKVQSHVTGRLSPAVQVACNQYWRALSALREEGDGKPTFSSLHAWCECEPSVESGELLLLGSWERAVRRGLKKAGAPPHSARPGGAPRSAAPPERVRSTDRS